MSVRKCEYTYPRVNAKGEEKLHTFTYKYTAKTNTVHCGKQKLKDKVTACTDEEQMRKLLAFMVELGL